MNRARVIAAASTIPWRQTLSAQAEDLALLVLWGMSLGAATRVGTSTSSPRAICAKEDRDLGDHVSAAALEESFARASRTTQYRSPRGAPGSPLSPSASGVAGAFSMPAGTWI